jgi:hypothetical protein
MEIKRPNHCKKFRLLSSQTCAICIEDIAEGILFHKTQRQTHILCLPCAEAYIVSQLKDNIKAKKYNHTISCSGTFNGNKRNACKHSLNVNDLKISDTMIQVHDLITRITALTLPGATECFSSICQNIVLVPDNFENANCPECKTTWCQKCNVSPYHDKMTCQKYKIMNDSSPEFQQMKVLITEGKVKLCPTCNHGVIKLDGCNKVRCSQCEHTMCWLCGQGNIDYEHFKKGICNKKLHE